MNLTEQNLNLTVYPIHWVGESVEGEWVLIVFDRLSQDVGILKGWSLQGELVKTLLEERRQFKSNQIIDIPDEDPQGIFSSIEVEQEGVIQSLSVHVNVDHPYQSDLVVSLSHPEGGKITLHQRQGRNQSGLLLERSIPDWIGLKMKGKWTLNVSDQAKGDIGSLKEWSLEASVIPIASNEDEE